MPLFDPANAAAIPETMKQLPNWVAWRYETRKGKVTKVPVNPLTRRRASSTDPTTWSTFEQALELARRVPDTFGIGFVFQPPWIGIDLDHKHVTPEIFKQALSDILPDYRTTYAEISPSNIGVHIYTHGALAKALKTPLGEMYTQGRFFTVTGCKIPEHPSTVCPTNDEIIHRTIQRIQQNTHAREDKARAVVSHQNNQNTPSVVFDPNDDSPPDLILFEALSDMQPRFRAIWDKKRKPEGAKGDTSDSAYEMSIARQAAQEEWGDQDIYRLLVAWRRKHNLPPKHIKGLQRTIAVARENVLDAQQDQELDDAVELPDEGRAAAIRNLLGLSIATIIQMGRDEGVYRLVLSDHTVVPLGTYGNAWKVSLWERIAFEHAHKVVRLSNKRWIKVINLLRTLVCYEESSDVSLNDEMEVWLASYTQNTEATAHDYETLSAHKPFRDDTGTYIFLSGFLVHLGIKFNQRPPRSQLANRLRSKGWEEVHLTATGEIEGEVASALYWRKKPIA